MGKSPEKYSRRRVGWFLCPEDRKAGVRYRFGDAHLRTDISSYRYDLVSCNRLGRCQRGPLKCKDEDYGLLWSRRLLLDYNGGEIEFGFVSPAWQTFTRLIPERDGSSQTGAVSYTTREDC